MPDLIVERIEVFPSSPTLYVTATIRVTIKNQGTVDLEPTNTFYTDLYVDPGVVPIQLGQDGVKAWGCQAWYVPAGGSYRLVFDYVFQDTKVYALYAQVDTDNHVSPEANENNNVLGPVYVTVRAPSVIVHDTHQEFQDGLASTLDVSHPEGVIRPGLFMEPYTDPEIYFPDTRLDYDGTPETPAPGRQINVALTGDNAGTLFAAWEDGRNGDNNNRDIYFSRGTDPDGDGVYSWGPNVKINDDGSLMEPSLRNQVRPDLVYDDTRNRLYAVWQDGRREKPLPGQTQQLDGNYDIYFAYSDDLGDTWSANVRLNTDIEEGIAGQGNPSITVGRAAWEVSNRIYVVWQDKRNGNEDIYMTRSDDGGATWTINYFVTDDPHMTNQDQKAPSVSVESMFGYVYVGWEDWRDPIHPEVYVMRSLDLGETFDIDVPVTIVEPEDRTTYRREPTIVAETTVEAVEHEDEFGFIYITFVPVTVVHAAWQDGEGNGADIYYSFAPYDWEEPDACPIPYEFCFTPPQLVSGYYLDSAYVRPPGEDSFWGLEPSWQGEVSIELVPEDQYWTPCLLASTEVYSKGVMIAWSDARPYDDWRYEIRVRRVATPAGDPKGYVVCERPWDAGTVNSNAKLHALRDTPDLTRHDSGTYRVYRPAATRQANPYLYIDETAIYIGWDDDRWNDPLAAGQVRDFDVFAVKAANWDDEAIGAFVSPVIHADTNEPAWYVLSWFGATAHFGDVLFQTRFGKTPNPPLGGEADANWTAWTGNPSNYVEGCPGDFAASDEPCYYDAPGRHIVDPEGNDWFNCDETTCPGWYPYIQYKITMKMNNLYTGRWTAVSQVTLHYQGPNVVYLPLVHKVY